MAGIFYKTNLTIADSLAQYFIGGLNNIYQIVVLYIKKKALNRFVKLPSNVLFVFPCYCIIFYNFLIFEKINKYSSKSTSGCHSSYKYKN